MTEISSAITLNVVTDYIADQFPEGAGKYAFAYHITLTNMGDRSVKLLNRYWLITDADGKVTEVAGPGVVGKQPVLVSGSSFSYTSGAILDTPVGTMQGHYEMQMEQGERFKLPIPVFRLAVPQLIN